MTKLYGTFVANEAIDLEIWPAEIHALLGENGAGKSTLVKMIYGLHAAERGRIALEGRARSCSPARRRRARSASAWCSSISRCSSNLTVAENVALGLDAHGILRGLSSAARARSRAPTACRSIRKREVWRLSVGERQRIEIVRCLLQNPKLLILDEPTSVLTPQEADQLFVDAASGCAGEGRAILYITHKLEEVKRALRHRDDPARRQGGRDLRSARGDRARRWPA